MRFLSRHWICMMGSTPSCMATRQPAQLGSRTTALWLSVTLAASTQSRSNLALRRIGATLAPRGGPISAVTAKRARCRAARKWLWAAWEVSARGGTMPLGLSVPPLGTPSRKPGVQYHPNGVAPFGDEWLSLFTPQGGPLRGRWIGAAAGGRSEEGRGVFDVGLAGPQAVVFAEPV